MRSKSYMLPASVAFLVLGIASSLVAQEVQEVSHQVNVQASHLNVRKTGEAVLHARGRMKVGDRYHARSIIGSTFDCRIAEATILGGRPAIVPVISGQAWITGTHQHMLDPSDPWPQGYRLADTWPMERT